MSACSLLPFFSLDPLPPIAMALSPQTLPPTPYLFGPYLVSPPSSPPLLLASLPLSTAPHVSVYAERPCQWARKVRLGPTGPPTRRYQEFVAHRSTRSVSYFQLQAWDGCAGTHTHVFRDLDILASFRTSLAPRPLSPSTFYVIGWLRSVNLVMDVTTDFDRTLCACGCALSLSPHRSGSRGARRCPACHIGVQ